MACAVVVAGLPPLSGFVAKFSLLRAAFGTTAEPSTAVWWMLGLLLASGFFATVSLSRTGIRYFWAPGTRHVSHVKLVEAVPVLTLILSCVLLTVFAEPVLRYTNATAAGLHAPNRYVGAVLSLRPRPGPTRPTLEEGPP